MSAIENDELIRVLLVLFYFTNKPVRLVVEWHQCIMLPIKAVTRSLLHFHFNTGDWIFKKNSLQTKNAFCFGMFNGTYINRLWHMQRFAESVDQNAVCLMLLTYSVGDRGSFVLGARSLSHHHLCWHLLLSQVSTQLLLTFAGAPRVSFRVWLNHRSALQFKTNW